MTQTAIHRERFLTHYSTLRTGERRGNMLKSIVSPTTTDLYMNAYDENFKSTK